MTLLNDFYTIMGETQEEGSRDYIIRLNVRHFIYKAHFPCEPITPGVCILQIAHELCQHALNKPLTLICVKNVKFMNIISPNHVNEVHYTISKISETSAADSNEGNVVRAQITVSDGGAVSYAKLSLMMKQNPS